MGWRTRIWDDRFKGSTKEEFRLAAGRYKKRRRALRQARNIDTWSFQQQEGSRLLSLPAEVRNLIYEYVFGHGTIHLSQRDCNARDNISLHWSGPFTRVVSLDDNGQPRHEPYVKYQKLTYATCLYPEEWQQSYRLSKRPACIPAAHPEPSSPYMPHPQRLNAYPARHTRCTLPVFELHEQQYLMICTDNDMNYHDGNECSTCDLHLGRQKLVSQYGPPEQGLKKLHSDSTLHLHILQTCKQVYREASLLPYAQYEFDLSTPRRGAEFAKLLTLRQRNAIDRVHIRLDCEMANHFKMVVRAFPCLRVLHQTRYPRTHMERTAKYTRGWAGFFRLPRPKEIQIITGYDNDREDETDYRLQYARYSEAFEHFLSSASLQEATAVAKAYKQSGGELAWEIPDPESVVEAGQPEELVDGLSPESSECSEAETPSYASMLSTVGDILLRTIPEPPGGTA